MSKREFRLLLTALLARLVGLLAAFTGVLLLLYFASDIITETGGDTVKTILGAAIGIFAVWMCHPQYDPTRTNVEVFARCN